jgi:carbamoyltransferase
MTAILGVSGFYHDSAAALVVDGEIAAAAQEERFTRKKHDASFPTNAVHFCLARAGLRPEQLDYVGFYDKPLLKFDRLLETYLAYAPVGFRSFLKAVPLWLGQKLHVPREISRCLGNGYRKKYVFIEHHQSHAASAFFPSPFEEAAVLTLDGVGEWATASFGSGRGNRLHLTHELRFPHSPGLLYSAFTYFCGFRVDSGEYKLMGLAPYGTPRYVAPILERLIDLKEDGSFRMDLSYFNYCQGLTMTSAKFDRLFGGPPRQREGPITQREMDLAASVQAVIEEVLLRMARHVHAQTGLRRLCLAGGVALNCTATGRLLREGPFEDLWVQPAAGDAGGALGVALFIHHQLLGAPRRPDPHDRQRGSFLGPDFPEDQIKDLLDREGAAYHHLDEDRLCTAVADLLAREKVVGWLQGRMEFGPRALGARSILADARVGRMQSVLNQKIKFRESFRPLAPAVLADHADEYFAGLPPGQSPYMLLTAPVCEAKRVAVSPADRARSGLDQLGVVRSVAPAVTHVDYSSRVQTVDARRHGRFHRLLERFHQATGSPLLVNTSFNVRGEPIVCTPEQAFRCFLATDMDALVLETFLLLKEEQAGLARPSGDAYLARFTPD